MRVAIFTPTQRPGIDVTHFSVQRQIADAEILWIICDELFEQRKRVLFNLFSQDKLAGNFDFRYFHLLKKDGNVRNLAAAYNRGLDFAREWDADLFISLQDYIWVPYDGVAKFIEMYKTIEVINNVNGIYTGICSISNDPDDGHIHDRQGLYTIFKEPYMDRPKRIDWMDVRYRPEYTSAYGNCPSIEWETNWACIPRNALHNKDLFFDEEFDKAVAFENQDYALKAKSLGYDTFVDVNNQTISLPHKRYFSEEWAYEEPLTKENQARVNAKWAL